MRHNKKFNHLGRQASHRKAMLANMASSLIIHKRINTTLAKAKALKIYLEPVITKSKIDSTHSRRMVFSYLKDKDATTELFREVAPKIADRPGGYTRILKTGFRLGDAAEMCFIELVDFNDNFAQGVQVTEKAKTRRSRSASAKKADGVTDAVVVEEGADAPKKAAAKKPAAPKAKAAAPRAVAPRVSGAKKVATKTAVSKKS